MVISQHSVTREYAAGFFDGEGSIGIYPTTFDGRDRYYLRTQITQSVSALSTELLTALRELHGGNLSLITGARRNKVYNWQLNSYKAAKFLRWLEPHLRLKREQAELAIAWQKQRPAVVRNERGHIVYARPPVIAFDRKVYALMRALKKADLQIVIANQSELADVVQTLRRPSPEELSATSWASNPERPWLVRQWSRPYVARDSYFSDSSFPRSSAFTPDLSAPISTGPFASTM